MMAMTCNDSFTGIHLTNHSMIYEAFDSSSSIY